MASATAVPEKTADRLPTCTRCGKEDAPDDGSLPRWCKKCRAQYQKEYRNSADDRAEARGFARGVRETKEILAGEFDRLRSSHWRGDEIAHLIRQAPGPKFDEPTNPTKP